MSRPLLVPGETCATLIDAPSSGLLVDGREFYRAVYTACCHAKRTIYMAGWQFASQVELVRGEDAADCPHPTRFLPFLRSLCEANPELEIYLLPWDSSPVFAFEREPLQRLKFRLYGHPRIRWKMDDAHPPGASHHQKLIIVDRSIAFVGGMDVCQSRWDDRDHQAELAQRCTKGKPDGPYHDVQTYVTGPGIDVLRSWFSKRWERATGDALEVPDAPAQSIPIIPSVELGAPRVGLARTLPPLEEPPCEPVTELLQLHLRAIAQAQRLIYIENQYVSSDELCRAFERRLSAYGPKLEIVMVLPKESAGFKERISIGVYQQEILARISHVAAMYGHGFGVYYQAARDGDGGDVPVFVHAKVLAVDDRFLLVSSANATNRSMSFDTELGLAWEAREPTDVLHAARLDLMSEHCGLPRADAEELLDPITGLVRRLDAFAGSRRGALRLHHRNVEERPGWLLRRILPPDTPLDPDSVEDLMPEPGAWIDRLLRDPLSIGRHLASHAVRRATRTRRRKA